MWTSLLSSRNRCLTVRRYISENSTTIAFDRSIKLLQREGAARTHKVWQDDESRVDYDYFRNEVARRLIDRLDDIKREDGFPLALEIGSGAGIVHRMICSDVALHGSGGIGGVRKLVQMDSSDAMLHRDENLLINGSDRCGTYRMVKDEEGKLSFPDGTFDLVISSFALHWVNKLPALFSEIKRVLKPDGCFMFAMIGGTTLPELRASFVMGEVEREGGVSPHVGPFVDVSDVGSLLTSAGFNLPTIDVDTIKIAFPNAMVLMEHLQRMGESNACVNRRLRVASDTILATSCIYDELYQVELEDKNDDACIEASVQVIYAIGWSPHDSQQRPSQRGSATHKVGEIVDKVQEG